MDAEKFAELIEKYVQKSAVNDLVQTFHNPTGKKPRDVLIRISEWTKNLSADDQKLLEEVISESVRTALFGLFAVIDGARTVDTGIDRFIIAAQDQQGQRTFINEDGSVDLHDYFAPNSWQNAAKNVPD